MLIEWHKSKTSIQARRFFQHAFSQMEKLPVCDRNGVSKFVMRNHIPMLIEIKISNGFSANGLPEENISGHFEERVHGKQ